MHNVYSLHIFIVFLLHVSVSHSQSSRQNSCAPYLKPHVVVWLLNVVSTVVIHDDGECNIETCNRNTINVRNE